MKLTHKAEGMTTKRRHEVTRRSRRRSPVCLSTAIALIVLIIVIIFFQFGETQIRTAAYWRRISGSLQPTMDNSIGAPDARISKFWGDDADFTEATVNGTIVVDNLTLKVPSDGGDAIVQFLDESSVEKGKLWYSDPDERMHLEAVNRLEVYIGERIDIISGDDALFESDTADVQLVAMNGKVSIWAPSTQIDNNVQIHAPSASDTALLSFYDNLNVLKSQILFTDNAGDGDLAVSSVGPMRISSGVGIDINDVMYLDSTKVSIGTETPNVDALLELASITKGFLPPRMTDVQRDAIATPPEGLILYDNVGKKLDIYDGTIWQGITMAPASTLEPGNVVFASGTHHLADDDDFFWDNSDKRAGIGTNTPDASAVLDVSSTTRGFLPPRMTSVQRDAIALPADGLVIYNSTLNILQIRQNGAWLSPDTHNPAKTIHVYQESDFGEVGTFYGETRRQLSYVTYVLHGIIVVTTPFFIPEIVGPPLANILSFATYSSSGSGIFYFNFGSQVPLFFGRDAGTIHWTNTQIIGGMSGATSDATLFDIEAKNVIDNFAMAFTTIVSSWQNLGRLTGYIPNIINSGFRDFRQGLVFQQAPLDGVATWNGLFIKQLTTTSPTPALSLSTPSTSITLVTNNVGEAIFNVASHPYSDGSSITHSGFSESTYNGTKTVINSTATSYETGDSFISDDTGMASINMKMVLNGTVDAASGDSYLNLNGDLLFDFINISNVAYPGIVTGNFFRPNVTLSITIVANSSDNPGIDIRITTSTTHPYQEFDRVSITNTANYNGLTNITKRVNDTQFDVPGTFGVTETGNVIGINLNEKTLKVDVFNCGAQKSSKNVGSMIVGGNTAATIITTQNVFVDLNINNLAVAAGNIERWTVTNATTGELKYDGVITVSLDFTGLVAAYSAGGTQRFNFRLLKNGSPLPAPDNVNVPLEIKANIASSPFLWSIEVSPGDLFRLQVENADGTSDITIDTLKVTIS